MSRQSTRGRHPCSSSSGSASYQGISGANSPIYHLPQEPFHNDFVNNRKKPYSDTNAFREPHAYYNANPKAGYAAQSSIADTHSYQYINEDRKNYRAIEDTFTDDDSCSSSRFQPYYDYQKNYDGYKPDKHYQNNFSEYDSDFPITHAGKKSFQRSDSKYHSTRSNQNILKVDKNVIVKHENLRPDLSRVYPETPLTRPIPEIDFHHGTLPRRDVTRLSDRAQSPGISSAAGSAIVDGCGGHCVTFENVCSYILQIFFIMGILIGVSLCIAGTVLRRTKSRDLQVLVYIGAMSAMVCTLLLTVQCRVRRALRKRKRAVRIACTAIPLGDMRPVQQPLINLGNDVRPGMLATTVGITMNQRPQEMLADEQGIPWWRRADFSNRV